MPNRSNAGQGRQQEGSRWSALDEIFRPDLAARSQAELGSLEYWVQVIANSPTTPTDPLFAAVVSHTIECDNDMISSLGDCEPSTPSAQEQPATPQSHPDEIVITIEPETDLQCSPVSHPTDQNDDRKPQPRETQTTSATISGTSRPRRRAKNPKQSPSAVFLEEMQEIICQQSKRDQEIQQQQKVSAPST